MKTDHRLMSEFYRLLIRSMSAREFWKIFPKSGIREWNIFNADRVKYLQEQGRYFTDWLKIAKNLQNIRIKGE